MDNSFDKAAWLEQKQAQRQQLNELSEAFLDRLSMQEAPLRQYLSIQGRFPQLSVGNTLLMAAQRPDTTKYQTFEEWQKDGIKIRSGEHGFSMFVPKGTYTRGDGKTATNYEVVRYFDITQTDEPNPEPPEQDINLNLKALLMRPVCPVTVVEQQRGAVYIAQQNTVEVGRGMKPEHVFQTLTLAFAHGEMAKSIEGYNPGTPQNAFYARCVSFVLCSHYGADTKSYHFMDIQSSFGNCNPKELRQHLQMIHTTSRTMVERMDKALMQLREHSQKQMEPAPR